MRREDLPPQVLTSRRGGPGGIELPEDGLDLEAYLDAVRADLMRQALERSDGVQTRAAEVLGMSFRSFRYYARKAEITGGDEGDGDGD
jgi:two-component system response regulator PilR (NtrC family)